METASVKSETVDVVEVTPEYAVVEAKGTSLDIPNVQVNRNFTIEANQEWITAKTVFKNTGNESQTFWIGDAIDYDGSGQRSAAGNNQVITLPYSTPRAFTLNEPWIGMTGNDKQVYGLIYTGEMNDLKGYGNGNWIMSQKQIELPAGESYTFERKIVAVKVEQTYCCQRMQTIFNLQIDLRLRVFFRRSFRTF